MEMAQRNKLNRKAYARLCCAFFWHKFKGATALLVRLLLLAQTKRLEQHVEVHTRIMEEITSSSGRLYEAARKW